MKVMVSSILEVEFRKSIDFYRIAKQKHLPNNPHKLLDRTESYKILHPGWSLRLRSDPKGAFEHEILPLILSFCHSCVHECLVWNPKIAPVGKESQQEDDLNRKLAMRFAVAFFQWGDEERENHKKATLALALSRFPK